MFKRSVRRLAIWKAGRSGASQPTCDRHFQDIGPFFLITVKFAIFVYQGIGLGVLTLHVAPYWIVEATPACISYLHSTALGLWEAGWLSAATHGVHDELMRTTSSLLQHIMSGGFPPITGCSDYQRSGGSPSPPTLPTDFMRCNASPGARMRAQPCAGGGATARSKSVVFLYNFRSITMIKVLAYAALR